MTSDPAIDSEPVSVLRREACPVRADDEPIEPVKNSARPFKREAVNDIEPINVLKIDICFVSVEDVPSEPERSSTRTCDFDKVAVIPIEPVNDLAKPLFSEATINKVAVRLLASPLV